MDVSADWKQDETAPTDEWRRRLASDGGNYGYIHQYESKEYCWQASRNGYRLAGLKPDRTSAMAAADNALAMPIEEFNAQVAAELKERIRDIEKDLQHLQPDAIFPHGYYSGFEAGQMALRRKIIEVMP